MTRTSRRLKEKPTQRLPLLRSGRDPAPPFDPAKLALTDPVPRSTAPCASSISAPSAAAAPKGTKHYSRPRGPTGLRPSTRKDRDGKERGEASLDTQLRGRSTEAKR